MERYRREHEKFIQEINDLRAKNKPDKNMIFDEENEFQSDDLNNIKEPLI